MERKEGQQEPSGEVSTAGTPRVKTVAIAILPLAVLGGMVLFLFGPGQAILNLGIPLPNVTIERVEFHEASSDNNNQRMVVAYVRNTGPETVEIAQADVNDRILPAAIEPGRSLPRFAEAKVIIPFPWNPGVPYEIGVTTSDGTRFSQGVEAAAPSPKPNLEQASFFALIGTYVGIIPVLIGLLWFPFIRRLSVSRYNFFLSLTAGLLVFLGIDALIESNEIAQFSIAGAFDGPMVIAMVTILTFVALLYASEKLANRPSKMPKSVYLNQSGSSTKSVDSVGPRIQDLAKPFAISLMIAIGIGLHNFGEGLAIGAAVVLGEVALSTFLIVGFTIHNTTEGLAIVAPMAKRANRVMLRRLVLLGLIAGVPTIFGAWLGGFLYSPIAAIIFLSIGAGAIFQVVYSIMSWMARGAGDVARTSLLRTPIVAGFAIGMLIMYLTGLVIPS